MAFYIIQHGLPRDGFTECRIGGGEALSNGNEVLRGVESEDTGEQEEEEKEDRVSLGKAEENNKGEGASEEVSLRP